MNTVGENVASFLYDGKVIVRLVTLILWLLLSFRCLSEENAGLQLKGTAVNTKYPDNPIAAPIEIVIHNGDCKLTIVPPLTGSGGCTVRQFDKKSGHIELVSFGSPTIVWRGIVKGNFASGTYTIQEGGQKGAFYLAVLFRSPQEESPSPVASPPPSLVRHSSCSPAIESSITGEIEGWSGETIFKLDNGQIWQQAEYDYTYFYEYHPDVTIYETTSGCRMKVEDESDTVLVKRIK